EDFDQKEISGPNYQFEKFKHYSKNASIWSSCLLNFFYFWNITEELILIVGAIEVQYAIRQGYQKN
ncbi:hypothetical protein MXB_5114, partial [Myxobolus squamalis]